MRLPREVVNHHPWNYLKDMWHLRTWFSGAFGRAGLTVGLDNLKDLFQSIFFCDSVIQISLGFSSPSLANFAARSPLLQGCHGRVAGTPLSYGKTTVTGTSTLLEQQTQAWGSQQHCLINVNSEGLSLTAVLIPLAHFLILLASLPIVYWSCFSIS